MVKYFQGFIDMDSKTALKFGLEEEDRFPNGYFGSMERDVNVLFENQEVILFEYLGDKYKFIWGTPEIPNKIEYIARIKY